jgi:hypothetical protein
MDKRVYICGAMTGMPEFNYPAFNAAAEELRSLGYLVENPAENPMPPCGSWAGYMRLSIAQVLRSDVVALLPCWEKSKGAKIERSIASDLGLEICSVEGLINGA